MASNEVKHCVSLVTDAKAVEDAAMVLEESLENLQKLHGLTRKELAPLRLVMNVLTNVTNSVKRNAKALKVQVMGIQSGSTIEGKEIERLKN